jgi:hypothetical protein
VIRRPALVTRHLALETSHFARGIFPPNSIFAHRPLALDSHRLTLDHPMRPVYFDAGFYWDDPNLRWGDPSYQLEPGDPGYVPWTPPSETPTPEPKKKRMKHNTFYPLRQTEQIVWLANLAQKIDAYATVLGLTTNQVNALKADCLWLIYILELWLPAARAWAPACTNAATAAQNGFGSGPQVLPVFTPPALPAATGDMPATVPVALGGLSRTFLLIQQIKVSGKCTDAIAADLRIVGTEEIAPDLSTQQPEISAKVSGNEVLLKWGWGGHRKWLSSCEFAVDRGDGHGFVYLANDTTPNYTDTHEFPTTKTVWTYKAIYHAGDGRVGVWSQTVSVTVGG